ncbi:MAG: hypothetical protein EAY81_03265 [Bacteroidetes bacterium]|nr:MAG: hypothetical protein EAY81_03265 [Bacteroidota bacterium]
MRRKGTQLFDTCKLITKQNELIDKVLSCSGQCVSLLLKSLALFVVEPLTAKHAALCSLWFRCVRCG